MGVEEGGKKEKGERVIFLTVIVLSNKEAASLVGRRSLFLTGAMRLSVRESKRRGGNIP